MVTALKDDVGWRFEEVEVVPTTVSRGTYLVEPAVQGSASYARTMETMNLMGAGVSVFIPPPEVPRGLDGWGVE
jgi:hypothetical protein